jgi:hypothetical protein
MTSAAGLLNQVQIEAVVGIVPATNAPDLRRKLVTEQVRAEG